MDKGRLKTCMLLGDKQLVRGFQKFAIVLVVVLVLGALGFRDRKETDVLQLTRKNHPL